MPVAMLDRQPRLQIDPQRGAEHRRLHIMRDDSVATEDDLDIAAPDQRRDMLARRRMHHRRAKYEEDLASTRLRRAYRLSHLMNRQRLGALGGDRTLHKAEDLATGARALQRLDANPLEADND